MCEENGSNDIDKCLELAHTKVDRTDAKRLEEKGLVKIAGSRIEFTEQGRERARGIVRRHRLAERLFTDILRASDEQSHEAACSFEHAIVPEVTESLCTLLGHPRRCPHGKSIPPGKCCERKLEKVPSAIIRLSDASCGQDLKIAYLRPAHHDRLHQLLSLGISPGAGIRLLQKKPLVVLEVEGSEIAIDGQVASDVYVWRKSEIS